MSTHVRASEAARLLNVSKATLYAYVSRGLVDRTTAVDGRTSLYSRESIERLAARSRRRPVEERPSIDVRIASAITLLSDDGVSYRGRPLADLASERTFEQVAELLWSGELPPDRPRWPVDRELLDRARATAAAARSTDPIVVLALAALSIADDADPGAAPTARRLLAIAPSLLGGPLTGTIASRLARAWVRNPSAELVTAIDRALVLLADHELATSTLAVRVAASVRTDPGGAIATGLHVVRGALHGTAGAAAGAVLASAATIGAAGAVELALGGGRRLPGFGHSVYRRGDPRLEALLEAVRALGDDDGRLAVVDAVLAEAGRRIPQAPNVDFGLAALAFVAGLPVDAPIFAVARIAGWAAHFDEELTERPVRFRGLAAAR